MSKERTLVFVSGSTSHMRDDMAGSIYNVKAEELTNSTSRPAAGV
jgi:hypothetical protein